MEPTTNVIYFYKQAAPMELNAERNSIDQIEIVKLSICDNPKK